MADRAEIVKRFTHQSVESGSDQDMGLAVIDADFAVLALSLDASLPDGREKAIVMTNLEQAWLWAGAAVVRA